MVEWLSYITEICVPHSIAYALQDVNQGGYETHLGLGLGLYTVKRTNQPPPKGQVGSWSSGTITHMRTGLCRILVLDCPTLDKN